MATTLQPPAGGNPTPERIFNTLNAFQQTEAMKAAIALDLFTAIGEGSSDVRSLASRVHAAERGVRVLCDFLTVKGMLTKTDGHYGLAPDTAFFLDKRSPAYMGTVADFLTNQHSLEAHHRIGDAVRKGGSAMPETPFEPDDPMWVQFAEVMMPMMHMPAQLMAGELCGDRPVSKVLDIASSHGMFGIAVAQKSPEAHIYAVDWPKVLEVGKRNAERAGLSERFHQMPGSAFEIDFGTGYDLALITNFLHHFDVPTCTRFLRKIHDALVPGGRVAILEFVPNQDRVSPPVPAAFSLIMLAMTPAGDAYTFDELSQMAKDAGFSEVKQSPTPMGAESLVVATK